MSELSRRRLLYALSFFIFPFAGLVVFFAMPDDQVIASYVLYFLVPVVLALATSLVLGRALVAASTAAVCAAVGSCALAIIGLWLLGGSTA